MDCPFCKQTFGDTLEMGNHIGQTHPILQADGKLRHVYIGEQYSTYQYVNSWIDALNSVVDRVNAMDKS